MRLNRLDLTRYGKFTDDSIVFDRPGNGGPDLHIIYGLNEAGKSTLFSAFLDLLFGIGLQSPYNFLHAYSAMRIGGQLEFAAGSREFVRVKQRNGLLDSQGNPISDAVIQQELGGIERTAYCTMFSLDSASFEEGGESILASQGELGQMLFAASAGLTEFSQRLEKLQEEPEKFWKSRRRDTILGSLKLRLDALKEERDRLDTAAGEYKLLVAARDQAEANYELAATDLKKTDLRIAEIQRYLSAYPRLRDLADLRTRFEPLKAIPEAPSVWFDDLPNLRTEEITLAGDDQRLEREIKRLEEKAQGSDADGLCQRMLPELARLMELRSRYVAAEGDLPKRRSELVILSRRLAGILSRMEREEEEDPKRLVLGASLVGRFRKLIESRSGIDQALESATRESSSVHVRLKIALQQLEAKATEEMLDEDHERKMLELATVVKECHSSDHPARATTARRAVETANARINSKIALLYPWTGDVSALLSINCPDSGRISRWKKAIGEAERALALSSSERQRIEGEVARLEAELAGIAGATGVVSDEEAATVRSKREKTWAHHRRTLDAGSADSFEEALRSDDIVTTARFAHVGDVEKLNQRKQSIINLQTTLSRTKDSESKDSDALRLTREQIGNAISAISPQLAAGGLTLEGLEDWLAVRRETIRLNEDLLAAQIDFQNADRDGAKLHSQLNQALTAAGIEYTPEQTLNELISIAQIAIDQHSALKSLLDKVSDLKQQETERIKVENIAKRGAEEWDKSWVDLCRQTWFSESSIPTVETAGVVLSALPELASALNEQSHLEDRIVKMENDQTAFGAQVDSCCVSLGIPVTGGSAIERADAVKARIDELQSALERRSAACEELELQQAELETLRGKIEVHNKRKTEMLEHFSVKSLDEVAEQLQGLKKRSELANQIEKTETEIANTLRVKSIEEAEEMLQACDRSDLEAEQAGLEARRPDLDDRCRQQFAAKVKASDKVEQVGGDAKIAEIEEERQTIILEIEDGATSYLRLYAGILAAQTGLQSYRERHRSSMMKSAGEAFRIISRGEYRSLATHYDGGEEVLIALPVGGGSKGVAQLSRGTRYQLYLSLRVAGYREFAQSRPSLPFIADDILESFDDLRAEETFRVFADMAKVGQIIYLTHHQHLCDTAKRVCPSVQIHHLGSVACKLL